MKTKLDQLADEYIKQQDFDEDCLCERTQPGTKYGECVHHLLCGCFIDETFKAGWMACNKHYVDSDRLKLMEDIEILRREKAISQDATLATVKLREDKITELYEKLLEYGSHKSSCACLSDPNEEFDIPCTCGFSDALK